MSNLQLQAYIRRTSQHSERIVFTIHAWERMLKREVIDQEVHACLRHGVVERPPQRDRVRNTLKCTMEHFGPGRQIAVVVALDDMEPDILVITVMTRTR